jgi:hypothetical protein
MEPMAWTYKAEDRHASPASKGNWAFFDSSGSRITDARISICHFQFMLNPFDVTAHAQAETPVVGLPEDASHRS